MIFFPKAVRKQCTDLAKWLVGYVTFLIMKMDWENSVNPPYKISVYIYLHFVCISTQHRDSPNLILSHLNDSFGMRTHAPVIDIMHIIYSWPSRNNRSTSEVKWSWGKQTSLRILTCATELCEKIPRNCSPKICITVDLKWINAFVHFSCKTFSTGCVNVPLILTMN